MRVAILDGNTVTNIVKMADDSVLAENEIAYSSDNPAIIGGDYVDGFFYPPQPFPSWTRDEGVWVSPVPMPEPSVDERGFPLYTWDEDSTDWIEVPSE